MTRAVAPAALGPGAAVAALPALLLAVVIVAFARFLGVGFVGTDSLTLVESSSVGSWGDAAALFAKPVMAGTTFAQGEVVYRPFVTLTFALEHGLWGLQPLGYHATNLALHAGATLAVWALLRGLRLSRPACLLGSLLFGLHPVVVATVPVLARRDSLVPVAAFTGAMALECYCAARTRRAWPSAVGALALYVVALLSKESAFATLLLVPAVLVVAGHGPTRARLPRAILARRVAPYIVLTVAIFVARFAVLGSLGGYKGTSVATFDLAAYRAVLTGFTRFLLWPAGELYPRGGAGWAVLLLAGLAGLVATSRGLPSRSAAVVRLGCLWVADLALFHMVVKTLSGAWLAYFPLVGLALVAGALADAVPAAVRALTRGAGLPARLWRGGVPLLLGAALALFALATLRASPLAEAYPEWAAVDGISRAYLSAAIECARDAPDHAVLTLVDVPNLLDYPDRGSDLLAPTIVSDNTVQAALDAFLPGRSLAVVARSYVAVRWSPEPARLTCARADAGRELAAAYD